MNKLPKRFTPQTVDYITIADSPIPVSILPEELQMEFCFLNELRTKTAAATLELETLRLATSAKTAELTAAVKKYLESQVPQNGATADASDK